MQFFILVYHLGVSCEAPRYFISQGTAAAHQCVEQFRSSYSFSPSNKKGITIMNTTLLLIIAIIVSIVFLVYGIFVTRIAITAKRDMHNMAQMHESRIRKVRDEKASAGHQDVLWEIDNLRASHAPDRLYQNEKHYMSQQEFTSTFFR